MLNSNRSNARSQIVEEHVGLENRHDLNGVMNTFGAAAQYDDEPNSEHHIGTSKVRRYYAGLFSAMPDVNIDIQERHFSENAIILEVIIRGHHLGPWRGLPATGRKVEFPLCGIFTFDDSDRLKGERIYYDRATVLRQLGVFHEPERFVGRINVALMHPITMAKVVGRMVFRG